MTDAFIVRVAIARVAGVLLVAGLAGCSASSTNPDTPSATVTAAAGTYALVQGNGQAPPIGTGNTDGNCARFIDSGSLALNVAGAYTFTLVMHAVCPSPGGGTNTVTNTPLENGTWSVNGSSLTLTRSGGSVLNESNTTLAGGAVTTTVQFDWAGALPSVTLILRK